jgi:hypothetical protein
MYVAFSVAEFVLKPYCSAKILQLLIHAWLRHCAISWKVVGSIPDGVIGIFHRHNPSGRTMALG